MVEPPGTIRTRSAPRSAARIAPEDSADRNSANVARSASPKALRLEAASASIRSRSDMSWPLEDSDLLEHFPQARARLLLHRDERQAELLLEQPHECHGRLHRAGVGLDEVRFHEIG